MSFGSGWNAFLKYVSIDRLYIKEIFMTTKHLLGPEFIFRMGLGARRVQRELSVGLRSAPAKSRVAMGGKRTKCVLWIYHLHFLSPSFRCIPGLAWCLLISLRPHLCYHRQQPDLSTPFDATGLLLINCSSRLCHPRATSLVSLELT